MDFEEDDQVDEVGSINSNHNINGDMQNGYARSYVTEETVDEEDDTNNLKFSLAHYFSTTFVVFVSTIITATIILFIWSNTSDGAWVSLQVIPVLPSNTTTNHNLNEWFPFAFSKLNSDSKSAPKSLAYILNALENNDNNMEKIKLLLSNNINGTLSNILLNTQDIKDLKLNLNVFHFSLVSAVSDFWQAEGYALSILIAAFSGVWPYVKLILLGVCWLIPMKQENREGIIIFLDQMGKFSFIDLFVSLYMIVSFYVSITKTFEGYGINLKVIVEPDIGLNTFVIGTAISMIFSHIFLILDAKYAKPHITQLIRQQKQQELDIQQNENENIDIDLEKINQKDQINTYHKCGPLLTKYLPSSIGGIILRSIMLLTIIYTVWGAVFSTFTAPVRYNITGLVGWAVSDPIRAFSPWEIITQVPTHTDEHDAAPPLCLTLFLTIVFFPILLNVVIFIIWYFPMKYKYLNYFNVFMQGCMAWSALDVFAVASIAASLELSRVSQWILNTNYASVCGPDGTIPHITQAIIGKKVQCFSVDGYLVWGIWIVLAVSIFSWILFIYTIQQLYQYKKFKSKLNHKNIADKTIFFFNH